MPADLAREMSWKPSAGLKAIWWAALVIALLVLLWARSEAILDGQQTTLDVAGFLIVVALLLAPIFSDVSLLGISLRREVQSLREDVRQDLASVRLDVRTAIDVRNSVTQTFHFLPPVAPPAELAELKREIASEGAAAPDRESSPALAGAPVATMDPVLLELFAVRFRIEREIERAFRSHELLANGSRPMPAIVQLDALEAAGLLPSTMRRAIRELYNVCSRAIHGVELAAGQLEFVREMAPSALSAAPGAVGPRSQRSGRHDGEQSGILCSPLALSSVTSLHLAALAAPRAMSGRDPQIPHTLRTAVQRGTRCKCVHPNWSGRRDLNPRHSGPQLTARGDANSASRGARVKTMGFTNHVGRAHALDEARREVPAAHCGKSRGVERGVSRRPRQRHRRDRPHRVGADLDEHRALPPVAEGLRGINGRRVRGEGG